MKNVSVTQLGNYAALVPVIILLLNQFDIKVTENDVVTIVAGFVALAGIVTSFYGRFRQGDVSVLGVKKAPEDNR